MLPCARVDLETRGAPLGRAGGPGQGGGGHGSGQGGQRWGLFEGDTLSALTRHRATEDHKEKRGLLELGLGWF